MSRMISTAAVLAVLLPGVALAQTDYCAQSSWGGYPACQDLKTACQLLSGTDYCSGTLNTNIGIPQVLTALQSAQTHWNSYTAANPGTGPVAPPNDATSIGIADAIAALVAVPADAGTAKTNSGIARLFANEGPPPYRGYPSLWRKLGKCLRQHSASFCLKRAK